MNARALGTELTSVLLWQGSRDPCIPYDPSLCFLPHPAGMNARALADELAPALLWWGEAGPVYTGSGALGAGQVLVASMQVRFLKVGRMHGNNMDRDKFMQCMRPCRSCNIPHAPMQAPCFACPHAPMQALQARLGGLTPSHAPPEEDVQSDARLSPGAQLPTAVIRTSGHSNLSCLRMHMDEAHRHCSVGDTVLLLALCCCRCCGGSGLAHTEKRVLNAVLQAL